MESDYLHRQGGARTSSPAADLGLPHQIKVMFALVAITLAGTWLIIHFGPEPRAIETSPDIWNEYSQRLISEPSDRLLLIFWLFMGLVAVLGGLFVAKQRPSHMTNGTERFLAWPLFVLLTLVLVVTLTRSTEPHDDWSGVSTAAVVWAALVTIGLAVAVRIGGKLWLALNLLAIAVAAAFLVGAGWQRHELVRDPFHFGIALDDFMRGASWSVPYVDYLPSYTALLGHPLVFFRGLPGEAQVAVATYWVLILQVASLALAFFIARQAIDRRNQGLALLLLIAPVTFAEVGTGQSALQSAPVIPSRVLLPLLAFSVLIWALKCSLEKPGNLSIPLMVSGLLLGLAAINNVEFGATAVAAGLITVALAVRMKKHVLFTFAQVLVGIVLASIFFLAATYAADNTLDLGNLVRIQLTYAAAGFDLHPIITIGPFMPVVLTAVLSVFLGLSTLRSTTGSDVRFTRGLVLLLMGLWTLFSMGYFTGRSFSSVLFAGLSIQLGVLLAVLADPAWKLISSMKWSERRSTSVALSALMLIPILFGLTLLMGSNPPQKVLAFGMSGRPVVETRTDDFDEARSMIEDVGGPGAIEEIFVIVGPSAVTSKIAGVNDGAVMSRFFLQVSKGLTEFQCERLPESGFLIVESQIAKGMKSLSACRQRLSVIKDEVLLGPEVTSTIFRINGKTG